MNGDTEQFKLTATELIKRQSRGRFVLFTDHDELYIKQLDIKQRLDNRLLSFDFGRIALSEFSENRHVANNDSATPASFNPPISLSSNRLSRVIAEEIRFRFNPPLKKPILLTADFASLLTDSRIIRFQGNVILKARHCKITTEQAIWSESRLGFYLPDVYRYNHKTYHTPAFFQVTDSGICQTARTIEPIEYIDPLDSIENNLLENVPESYQMLFGLMNTQNGQDVSKVTDIEE